jgi:uncharacterized RDD family membrane protein YckC
MSEPTSTPGTPGPQEPYGATPPPPPPAGGYQQGQGTPGPQAGPGGYQAPYQQPGPGGYQAPYQQPAGPRPAELLDRFLARLVDYVLLAIVNAIIVSTLIVGAILGSSAGVFGFGGGGDFVASLVASVIGVVITLGYFAWMESNRGQTVGKMLLKLRVHGPNGGNPSFEQAVRRNAFTALSLIGIVPLIGWLLAPVAQLVAVVLIAVGINNDTARRQGWHDQFAGGTTVVKEG